MSFASSVETLELNSQGSKEVLGISPGTYIRLVQQLKGKPLFPQLKRLCIEDYHGLVDFFPLFLSSNLRSIRLLSTKPPTIPVTTASLVLRNLICDLSEWSQEIQHLHIAQSTILQTWMFNSISILSNLRTLELSPVQVKNFEEFHPLAPLALESLTLELSCSSYTSLPYPITPLPDFLALLKKLRISGSSIVIADFVQSLGSQKLTSLAIEGKIQADESAWSSSSRCMKHRTLKTSSKLKKTVNHRIHGFESILHRISLRWGESLQEITIISQCDACIDFAPLPSIQLIEKIYVSDFPINDLEHALKPTAIWNHLDNLHLTVTITFPLLSLIALYAPQLKKLDVSINTSGAPPADNQQVPTHPLNLLKTHGPSSQNSEGSLCRSANDVPDLSRLIQVARYLNSLFPTLKELTSTSQIEIWELVWQLLVLCQTCRADGNCQRPVHNQESEVL